ncbi:MAG: hypothetical protein IPO81_15845 [Kouleothrix sp.]|nr:hypothetical protein [Kouleothrix sp.]
MIDELYGASSIVERLQHSGAWYRAVEVEWVYVDRARPIAPYPTLIADYHRLGDSERIRAEQYMDELFTAAEFELLRRHFADRLGLVVHMGVIPIPMLAEPEPGLFMANPAQHMLEVDQGGKAGWYTLADPDAALLPFRVAAWYHVGRCAVEGSA